MNRTIKDATVKRFHYDDHDQLRRHLADFVAAYNFGRRLKTPTSSSARHGLPSPNASLSIRSSKCRDFSIRRVEVNRFQASSTTGI